MVLRAGIRVWDGDRLVAVNDPDPTTEGHPLRKLSYTRAGAALASLLALASVVGAGLKWY